jgi:hypothetical protein
MAGTLLGSGKYTYEPAEGWGKLPDGRLQFSCPIIA